MSKELVVSSNRHETKVAILEDDQLVEIYFQRAHEYSLAGSIHKGRVTRVLPGMQSAFVDLGLERDTFLYVSDFFEEHGEDFDRVADEKPVVIRRPPPEPRFQAPPPVVTAAPPVLADADMEDSPAASAPPQGERPERSGDRQNDGRGRRGRRRRTRGGGFPESKYASVGGANASENGSREQEPEVAPEAFEVDADNPAADIILLPGESLAKYRNRPIVSEDVAEDVTVSLESEPAFDEAVTALVPEIFATEPNASEIVEPAAAAPTEVESQPQPVYNPFAPKLRSEPEREAALTPEASPEPEALAAPEVVSEPEVSHIQEPLADTEDQITPPVIEEPLDNDQAQDETGSSVPLGEEASLGATSEEYELAARSLPSFDDLPADEDPVFDDAADDAIPAEALAGESNNEPTLSATVREPGNRFPHRGSRRMRRRRGGEGRVDRPDNRPADGGPAQQGRAQEPAPEVEPEVRTVVRPLVTSEKPALPSITDLLKEGQEIIVQIAKEPLGQKGARITSHIALPGRYVVYMPTLEHLGVSRKIASDEERQRLKKVLQAARVGMSGGFIVRTAGEGHTDEEIAADMAYLYNLWLDMRQKAEKRPAPMLLHHDLDIVQRILRDQLNDMFKAIWCDNEEVYESVLRFLQRFQPSLVGRVKMYTRPTPIFDAFSVTQEIEKGLRPKVWLKSGGYIVINQTEALVAIDVNTGKYVGKSNRLEDTITKTNTEAVKEIVRQIRLRDLGGIIVVDFIDMDERKNRQKVMQTLEEAMRADRAPYKILQFNDFGLVAITRKRVKQSLERSLCTPCPTCEGASYVKSVQTVVGEMLQEAAKVRPVVEGKNVILRAYPDVAKFLKLNTNNYLEEMEEILGRPVLVTSDPLLHPEKFDLAW